MENDVWSIEWSDKLSVGIPEIDQDHQRLITLLNNFNKSVADRMPMTEIKKRLQDLIDDAIHHFLHEENLLEEWQYPDVENHAHIHAQISGVLHDIMANLTHMSTDYQWIDAGLKIKKTLIDHMLIEDMRFVEYYRNSRSSPTAGRA